MAYSLVSDETLERAREGVRARAVSVRCSLDTRAAHKGVAVLRGVEGNCKQEKSTPPEKHQGEGGVTVYQGDSYRLCRAGLSAEQSTGKEAWRFTTGNESQEKKLVWSSTPIMAALEGLVGGEGIQDGAVILGK